MSKGDGWIQTKTRISPTTGKKTVRYIARFTPPGGVEESKSFARQGRSNEIGTAAHWLHQKREEVKTRIYINPQDRQWTVAGWADGWLDAQTGISDETRAIYRNVIELDIKPSGLGDEFLITPDRNYMGKWTNNLVSNRWWAEKNHAPATAAVRRTVVAMIFGAAHDEELIPRNPMRKVRSPQRDVDVAPIDPDEIPTRELVWHLYDTAGQVAPLIQEGIIMASGSGLRPGELLGLRDKRAAKKPGGRRREFDVAEQLKLKAKTIQFTPPKSSASRRRVPIGIEVDEAVGRHLERYPLDLTVEDGDVIMRSTRGRPWRRSSFASQWDRVRIAAGVPNLQWYKLRHFYVSVLIDGGASPRLVMERVGHSSSKYTLERYARLWTDSEELTRELSDAGLRRDRDGTIVPDLNAAPAPETV